MIYYANTKPTEPLDTGDITAILDVTEYNVCNTNSPCGTCGCVLYYMPYIEGDIFTYQFTKSLSEVYAVDCEGIEQDISGMISTNPKVLILDTSNVLASIFSIRIVYADSSECCLEFGFKEANQDCEENTLLIYGEYPQGIRDCNNNLYDGIYSNGIRINAYIQLSGYEMKIEENSNGRLTKSESYKPYDILFNDFVYPDSWLSNHLAVILQAKRIIVQTNSKMYYLKPLNGTFNKGNGIETLWLPKITLNTDDCSIDFRCN